MNHEKRMIIVIFALVAIVALAGLLLLDNNVNARAVGILVFGRGGQYSEDAASFPDLDPLTGNMYIKGRSRRFAGDSADYDNFYPNVARRE